MYLDKIPPRTLSPQHFEDLLRALDGLVAVPEDPIAVEQPGIVFVHQRFVLVASPLL